MQTKELYNSSTQVSTSIYFLKVTATFNLLTGGYKRSIATDYQENLITSDQQLKKIEENGQGSTNYFLYMPQNYKKFSEHL